MWHSSVDKTKLHPSFLYVMERTVEKLAENKTPFKVYSGLRTYTEQEKLYAQGRTTPGLIVTKSKGGQSMHNYGLAVDLAPLKPNGDLYWPELKTKDGAVWYILESILEDTARAIDIVKDDKLDYEWGGRWKTIDAPHCQIRVTLIEINTGYYPATGNIEWSVAAHKTFLFETPWIKVRTQYILNKLGYDVGKADGVFGPRTSTALKSFLTSVNHKFVDGSPVVLTSTMVELLVRAYHVKCPQEA